MGRKPINCITRVHSTDVALITDVAEITPLVSSCSNGFDPRFCLKERDERACDQLELPGGAGVTPRVPPHSMAFCTRPEALAFSTNSLT